MIRNPHRAIASVLVCAVLATACGSDGGSNADSDDTSSPSTESVDDTDGAASASSDAPASPDATASSEPSTAEPAAGTVEDGSFPVTIPHKYGETTIESLPQRIVLVGLTEQDALYALGVAPVAVTEWFGGYEYAAWPWAQPYVGDAQPIVLDATDGISYEKVASVKPDLIVGLYSGLTQEEFDKLSAIAPTVAQPAEYTDWGIPWQEATRTIGKIVGQPERAAEMVAEVEARFDTIRTEHPEFAGASSAVVTPYEGVYVYGPEDARGRLLDSLGLVMPAELLALATEEYGFQLSLERLDLLDVDVLVWLDAEDAGEAFTENVVYNNLAVHTEGREVLLDSEAEDGLGGATSFVTVLSLPFLLDSLVPMMAAAIDGDPATTAG